MTGALTFTETFTVTADNPLLGGHVVYGHNLLPGVGYVDLVLQVLARHGPAMSSAELRNLTILAPLVAVPGERILTTVEGKPGLAGECRIEIRSRRPQDAADVLHATVTAHQHEPMAFQERLTLPLAEVNQSTPLAELYTWLRDQGLVHSGLMKSDGIIHHRAEDWVVEVGLGSANLDSAGDFLFHPALFEAGVLGGGVGLHMLYQGDAAERLYLPLVFESFRAVSSLGTRCFVRVPADSAFRDDELFRIAVEFFDETGLKIGEVDRLVAKQVRDVSFLDLRKGAARGGDPVNPPVSSADPSVEFRADRVDTMDAAVTVGIVRELVAARLGSTTAQIAGRSSFYELGLASADMVSLVPEIESRLSLSLSPTIMFEHRSVDDLAVWLAGRVEEEQGIAVPEETLRPTTALVDEISALLAVPADEVALGTEFAEFGFDLTGLTKLTDRLNDRFGTRLTPSVFVEQRTVRALAEHIDTIADTGVSSRQDVSGRPHTLLHSIERDGLYRTRFDGSESFLQDHQVNGSRLLPGVVQLEMARAAVAHTVGESRILLENVVWQRPASCGDDGLELQVEVTSSADDGWAFTLRIRGEDDELTTCGKGRARIPKTRESDVPSLDELRAACAGRTIPAAEVYRLYADAGMVYGPAQQSIKDILVGEDETGRPQALADLRLPVESDSLHDCRLQPSVVDGALQALVGLQTSEQQTGPALPFALRHVDSITSTPSRAYAWVRHHDSFSAELDITVFDELGRVCVDLSGLSTRALPVAPQDVGPRAEASAVETPIETDIAIVGLSGRYPQSADLEDFWRNLRSGRDCIQEVPAQRWDHRQYTDASGSSSGKWGGFVDGIEHFDPLFFQISLHEAELLDPQERLFLETAHHALEDAGYAAAPPTSAGVFVGVMYQEYHLYGAQAQERGRLRALSGSASTVANRVSYFYNLNGPSVAVDTMCSSSLTALHLACEAIKSGQCGMALAGGVNLHSHPNKFLMLSQRRFLSSDGRCRSFGAGGDGYVPGEGVGVAVLKPLRRAIADGDHIHGVIKGTALNHGGRTSGYSVPSQAAQARVITDAVTAAGVDPRSLSYLEAHGTGTALGDPIEIAGLAKSLRFGDGLPEQCAIGSVKSNIGHCESAAGIAGITKVLLQMRHRELVPSLHSGTLNPHIDFDGTPLRVQQHVEPWDRPTIEVDGQRRTQPRIAGVSGFGAGGSNAHVVIAEYEAPQGEEHVADLPALFVLSAQSEAQLVEQAWRLHARLGELTDAELHDVAWTLQVGRMALDERLAFAAMSLDEARTRLESFTADPRRIGPWQRGSTRLGPADAGADESALRAAVSDWTERGAYQELLRLWAEGGAVEWENLYRSVPPARRVSLPGYPFARERCWFDLDHAADHPDVTESAASSIAMASDEMVLLHPEWVAQDIAEWTAESSLGRHAIVIGSLTDEEREAFTGALSSGVDCHFIEPVDGPLDHQYTDVVDRVFTLVHGILRQGVRQASLLQVALVGSAGSNAERERMSCFGGITGLLKTVTRETSLFRTQFVECLDGASPEVVAARLMSEDTTDPAPEVRHRDDQRLVSRVSEVPSAGTVAAPWRAGGSYLITGGVGGLGLVVARDIVASVDHATIVLVGRSPLSGEKQNRLEALRAAGVTVEYRRADVADRASVARMLSTVTEEHGPLTGILHSAGITEDSLLLRKSSVQLTRVLAPKVAGLVNLDELSRDLPLEFFVSFSSTAGAFGNFGQADYAAGNAFMDAYTIYRNRLVESGDRAGRTVSVNWPLWEEGGMGDAAARANLRAAGLATLDTTRGLTALRCALADSSVADGRLLVLVGERGGVLSVLNGGDEQRSGEKKAAMAPGTASQSNRAMADRAVTFLRRVLASSLKLGAERLDPDASLELYGMDSVIAVDVITNLEESFGTLPRTLLFEVQTIRELARYFAENQPETLRSLIGEPVPSRSSSPPAATTRPVAEPERDSGDQNVRRERTGNGTDVAIIGLSGRYPQAADLDALWANLHDARDCVTSIPADRWDSAATPGVWGGFLDGIDRFDPLHFGISPREAAAMDPQQRLFLETTWHLLENSGVTQEDIERRYGRRVGVYVGAAYQLYRAEASDTAMAAVTSAASYNMIANRVSHFFGLEGPSLAVDSMCASSAMAIHLACADLERGETELAVAGGINLHVHPDKYLALAELQLLGSHPGSRSFRDGDGYLPAEAVGAVLLKPLDTAIRDGDAVHAIIRATASMHGGRSNGFMLPSPRTQVNVMRRALERADVEPGSVGYVEAAANGTSLSDEVEFRALREVFGGVTGSVPVGTVKSNLGHPEAASGIAQLTKVVLQLRNRQIAPLVQAGSTNPNLDLDGTALHLCDSLTAWEQQSHSVPPRALINSVAAGGSHVSLVVEAPPRTEAEAVPAGEHTGPQLVLVSARNALRLRTAVRRLQDFLDNDDSASLADIAYTSQLGREPLPERLAVVVETREGLKQALAKHLTGVTDTTLHAGNADKDAGPLGAVLFGPRSEEFLAGLVADGSLEQLAELWVHGVRVPWGGLHHERGTLVPLPLTAFEQGSYWAGREPQEPADTGTSSRGDLVERAERMRDRTITDSERIMVVAWSELLQIETDQLGTRSDFLSLGGNSLLGTRLVNLLKQQTGAELPVQAVLDSPRLEDMAAELQRRAPSTPAATPQAKQILEAIALVEDMSEEELDALDTAN